MDLPGAPDEARRYFADGYRAQMERRLDQAIALYRKSIDAHPTAEAHTFLGWAYSMQGRVDDAIRECHAAIAIDPDFGNPYNDIGAYLIEQGRLDEALPWLERAKRAPRYEPRHFPHMNLARIHAMRHRLDDAVRELDAALALPSVEDAARRSLSRERHRLLGLLN